MSLVVREASETELSFEEVIEVLEGTVFNNKMVAFLAVRDIGLPRTVWEAGIHDTIISVLGGEYILVFLDR